MEIQNYQKVIVRG